MARHCCCCCFLTNSFISALYISVNNLYVGHISILVLWYPCHLLIGRLAASNGKKMVTHEKFYLKLDILPHQVDGDPDERDEHASNADHGEHPGVQLRVVWNKSFLTDTNWTVCGRKSMALLLFAVNLIFFKKTYKNAALSTSKKLLLCVVNVSTIHKLSNYKTIFYRKKYDGLGSVCNLMDSLCFAILKRQKIVIMQTSQKRGAIHLKRWKTSLSPHVHEPSETPTN